MSTRENTRLITRASWEEFTYSRYIILNKRADDTQQSSLNRPYRTCKTFA